MRILIYWPFPTRLKDFFGSRRMDDVAAWHNGVPPKMTTNLKTRFFYRIIYVVWGHSIMHQQSAKIYDHWEDRRTWRGAFRLFIYGAFKLTEWLLPFHLSCHDILIVDLLALLIPVRTRCESRPTHPRTPPTPPREVNVSWKLTGRWNVIHFGTHTNESLCSFDDTSKNPVASTVSSGRIQ